MDIRKTAQEFYLLYFCEYLTISRIAEDYGISEELAKSLIVDGKKINNDNWHPEQ